MPSLVCRLMTGFVGMQVAQEKNAVANDSQGTDDVSMLSKRDRRGVETVLLAICQTRLHNV